MSRFLSPQSPLTSLKQKEKIERNGLESLCFRNVTAMDVPL